MSSLYDKIGANYSSSRGTDPTIAKQLHAQLNCTARILNIGAGTGSYEPDMTDLIALEPSEQMIRQRKPDAHTVIQASAENLPFQDDSFSHTMTVLSMHHWQDRAQAFAEINRDPRSRQ